MARTEETLHHVAETTGAVILGRAGVFALKGVAGVLNVRLDGDIEARRRAAAARYGIDDVAAAPAQQPTDRARHPYVPHFYPPAGAWPHPPNYAGVLDSTALPPDPSIDLIVPA